MRTLLFLFLSALIIFMSACKDDDVQIVVPKDTPPIVVPLPPDTAKAVQNLVVVEPFNTNSIILNWQQSSISDSIYFVYRGLDTSNFSLIDSTFQTQYYDSTNVVAGIEYYYKVNARKKNGNYSLFSQIRSGSILESYSLSSSFGQFVQAHQAAFGSDGKLYITDGYGGKVKIYDSTFVFEKDIIISPNPSFNRVLRGINFTANNELIVASSNFGELIKATTQDSILNIYPLTKNSSILREVEIDQQGNIYVNDVDNREVVKFNSSGVQLKTWQLQQQSSDPLFYPSGLEIINNEVYVTGVNGNQLIEIYDLDGIFKRSINLPFSAAHMTVDASGNFYFACFNQGVIKTSPQGLIMARITNPSNLRAVAVSVDHKGNVYVADENNPTVMSIYRLD